jgi:feruloyl esterase
MRVGEKSEPAMTDAIRGPRRRASAVLFALVLSGGVRAMAQPSLQFDNWKDQAPPKTPRVPCAALRALTGYEFSIDTAVVVPAAAGAAGFCRVVGLVPPEVRFEVSLPADWNGRLYMFGNGGFAGESLAAANRVARRNTALAKGFAVAQTNTGHDAEREPLASFAGSPQKLVDYAYRAVHVTAMTAKRLAHAYYEVAPLRSYFDGCSTGGRQGLISAQRFPEDFDGIVVGAPVLDLVGTMVHYAKIHRALATAPLSEEKLRLVAEAVYRGCDAADGLADGLLADPRRCSFDPARDLARCGAVGTATACLSENDIASLAAFYGEVSANGRRVFPGFPVGAEVFAPGTAGPRSGWDPWFIRSGQATISRTFAESFFKHMATPGIEIDWRTFDPDRDLAKLETISALLNATDPDLGPFRKRGGKILMYFGWADPALNPLMGVGYYERVREAMGPHTSGFFRLFMMPGVFHCAGGVGPDQADTFTPLADWVEQGKTPERIVASRRIEGKAVRTRPLCPYPMLARYQGSGSIDDAANFACAAPAPGASAPQHQSSRERIDRSTSTRDRPSPTGRPRS